MLARPKSEKACRAGVEAHLWFVHIERGRFCAWTLTCYVLLCFAKKKCATCRVRRGSVSILTVSFSEKLARPLRKTCRLTHAVSATARTNMKLDGTAAPRRNVHCALVRRLPYEGTSPVWNR